MKGQIPIMAAAGTMIAVALMALFGLVIYGQVTDVYPHQQNIINETRCTADCNNSISSFTNTPVLNDTAMICFNDTRNLMTNGLDNGICLGYNIIGLSQLNLTNTSDTCQLANVQCSYTFDESNDNEQSFYNSNTSITFSGFSLLSVIVIVLAAVAIVAVVLLIKA